MAVSMFLPRLVSLLTHSGRSHHCPDCGAEWSANFRALKRSGHHRARVFYARLPLERRVNELYCRLPLSEQRSCARTSDRINALAINKLIEQGFARRLNKQWSNSSKVVHGGPCCMERASQIVNAIQAILHQMEDMPATEDSWGLKPVLGFAGAVSETDYEREQLIEQFGDAMLAR